MLKFGCVCTGSEQTQPTTIKVNSQKYNLKNTTQSQNTSKSLLFKCISIIYYIFLFISQGSLRIRGDSHVLIVGDPGLGKSQMLRAISAVAPRGRKKKRKKKKKIFFCYRITFLWNCKFEVERNWSLFLWSLVFCFCKHSKLGLFDLFLWFCFFFVNNSRHCIWFVWFVFWNSFIFVNNFDLFLKLTIFGFFLKLCFGFSTLC